MGYLMEQGKRYKVTGWHSLNPREAMTVWVDSVTDTEVRGHIRPRQNYGLVSSSLWDRDDADTWVWVEIAR